MSKEILAIKDFGGIVNDDTSNTLVGFSDMSGLDIFSTDGVLQINKRLKAETHSGLTETILDFTTFDGTLIASATTKEIWYESSANTWTLLHTNANAGNITDVTTYQKYLLYHSDRYLGITTTTTISGIGWNDSFQEFSNGVTNIPDRRVMVTFQNRLYISDGQYVAELDGASDPTNTATWIWTPGKFTLPASEVIQSMAVFGNQIAIGTEAGNFYLWDGVSANADQIIPTSLGGIYGMIEHENTLYIFAGIQGEIFRYTGSDFLIVKKVPGITASNQHKITQSKIRLYKNGFIFAINNNGIYIYNRIDATKSYSLIKYGDTSTGNIDTLNTQIGAIYMIDPTTSTDQFVIGYTESGEKIDRTSNDYYNEDQLPYGESVFYEIPTSANKGTLVQGVKLDTLLLNNDIRVSYKGDDDSSFNSLGSINSTNKNYILKGINRRLRKIKLRLEFGNLSITGLHSNTQITGIRLF